jgi:hypothetical protein
MLKICIICNKEFKAHRLTQKTCSKTCMGVMNSGENNPNFGKKWTEEEKQVASTLKKKQFSENPEYRYKAGASNRGVKFSEDRIKAMHENRTTESYRRYPTETVRKIIGKKSKEKWTDEYKEKYRQRMEDLGHWVPLKDKDQYTIYYKDANWQGSMIEYFDDIAKENLSKFGIFGRKNSKGWVRDHIVSRMLGYEFKLPVCVMRHPANLQFISHADNVRKGFADRRLTDMVKQGIINELLERIKNYNTIWTEQSVCMEYIRNKI